MIFLYFGYLLGSVCLNFGEARNCIWRSTAVPMLTELNPGQGNYVACLSLRKAERKRERLRRIVYELPSCLATLATKPWADPSGPLYLLSLLGYLILFLLPFDSLHAIGLFIVSSVMILLSESITGNSKQVGKFRKQPLFWVLIIPVHLSLLILCITTFVILLRVCVWSVSYSWGLAVSESYLDCYLITCCVLLWTALPSSQVSRHLYRGMCACFVPAELLNSVRWLDL